VPAVDPLGAMTVVCASAGAVKAVATASVPAIFNNAFMEAPSLCRASSWTFPSAGASSGAGHFAQIEFPSKSA
jgi:hypothetical protein